MPRKLGAPVLTLQGLGEEKIVPDRVQGSGALMGARARRKPSLSLERFNSRHTINTLGWVCLLSIPDRRRYMDAKALVRRFGKPDIFLTMTCNPNWDEIKCELYLGQTP
jgi:hypothetical protein